MIAHCWRLRMVKFFSALMLANVILTSSCLACGNPLRGASPLQLVIVYCAIAFYLLAPFISIIYYFLSRRYIRRNSKFDKVILYLGILVITLDVLSLVNFRYHIIGSDNLPTLIAILAAPLLYVLVGLHLWHIWNSNKLQKQ